jgi:hypothetical protein
VLIFQREQIDFRALQQKDRFDSLDQSAQFILKHMNESRANIESQLHSQTRELQRLCKHSDVRLTQEHEKTRSEIRAAVHQLRGDVVPVTPSNQSRYVSFV